MVIRFRLPRDPLPPRWFRAPSLPADYCGDVFTNTGAISLGTDGVTVSGTAIRSILGKPFTFKDLAESVERVTGGARYNR